MTRHSYRERDYTFGQAMLKLRTSIGLTQAGLADLLRVSRRAVGEWEAGRNYPKAHHLQHFFRCVCSSTSLHQGGRKRRSAPCGKRRINGCSSMRPGSRPCSVPSPLPQWSQMPDHRGSPRCAQCQSPVGRARCKQRLSAIPRIDWVGALDVSRFTGREGELAELSQWIVQEQCRLVAILGMGGIGKSALVSLLGKQLAPQFDAVLWRSLRDAPSCEELVADCITFFSETPPAEFSPLLEQRINQLIGRLQERRCLLVLDNLETLLEVEDPEGNYRAGYQGYGRLIERLGESAHQSCVVLTSREKPREIEALEGPRGPVRSLRLLGLSEEAARSLLEDKDLRGESLRLAAADRQLRGQSARPQDRGPGHRRPLCRRNRPVPALGGADLQWHPRGTAPASGTPDAAGADAAHLAGGGARVDVARFLALPAGPQANARAGAGGVGSALATVPDRAGSREPVLRCNRW